MCSRFGRWNPSGVGTASASAAATPVPPPAKPSGLAAVGRNLQAELSWTALGDASVTQYQYRQKEGQGNYGSWQAMAGSDAATTSHAVTGLKNGTAYAFKIRALNPAGAGAESNEATATPVSPPAQPTGLTAVGKDRRVELAWADPQDASITQYQYRQKEGKGKFGDWTAMAGSGAATTSYAATGLKNGTEYGFRIRAVNPAGNGDRSGKASATPAAAPAKPAGLTALGKDGQADLAWSDPSDATITQYQYRQKAGQGNYGDWTDIPGSTAATVGYTVPSLTNGTVYTFKVRALNASGTGAESDEATALPAPPPAKPTGLAAAARNQGVHLSWSNPNDASITQYQYRQKDGKGKFGDWTAMAGSGAATTSHTVTGLKNETEYGFRIRAVNPAGNGERSDKVSATPTGPTAKPAKPAGLAASARDRGAYLSWTDPNDKFITKWQYRKKVGAGNYGGWTDITDSGAATTSHTVAGLANGVAHAFKVRALNALGAGAESNEATATPVAAPSKPTGLTAAARDRGVHLAWTAAGNATITQWQYRQKIGRGSYGEWTAIANSGAATTSYTVTGLANGTEHAFRIRAVNSSGNGARSDEATATPAPAPSKPTGLTASARDKGVHLSWTNPNDATITRWQYRQKAGRGDYGEWTNIADSGAATTSHTVTGLENGTVHAFKVRAVNSSGAGAESGEATATPVAPPAKPTGLAASARDRGVHLSWTDPNDASIIRWQYRQKVGTGDYGEWTAIANSGAATASHTVTGLTNGEAHGFQIRAVNPAGNGTGSDEATATPAPAPAKPTGLTASARNQGVHLSWTAAGNATITQWQYRQKTGRGSYGNWTAIANSGAATTSHTVTGLTNNTAHAFKIRALNSSGTGAESNEVAATPVPVPSKPTGLAASARDRGVHLSWANPNDASITRWQYRQKAGTGDYGEWTAIANSGAATTSHTVTGLTNGTEHAFKVRALELFGHGGGIERSGGDAGAAASEAGRTGGLGAGSGRAFVVDEPERRIDHPVAVPAEGWQGQLRGVDGDREQRCGDDEPYGDGVDERHGACLQGAGTELFGHGGGIERSGGDAGAAAVEAGRTDCIGTG